MRIDRIYKEQSGERSVFRCTICNKVNNQDIETNLGDFDSGLSFVVDPSHPHDSFICIECNEAIRDVNYDYEILDDIDE